MQAEFVDVAKKGERDLYFPYIDADSGQGMGYGRAQSGKKTGPP